MYKFYNEDCIKGAQKHIKDNTVDLIICDPPYGIKGDKLDKHYNRNENFVLNGYVEVPEENYFNFSVDWIKEAERILKPGGSIYIVSGYTNLVHVLNALGQTNLKEVNHLIWKYNFGVYTKTKYISSHYHILYYVKPGKKHTFNTYSRYSDSERTEGNGSSNYADREDVWIINREYKPGKIKNKNELPTKLLIKLIQYSSNEGDVICDMFLGSFSTAKVAKGLNRKAIGFELSKDAFSYQVKEMDKLKKGCLLDKIRIPAKNKIFNGGKKLTDEEKNKITEDYSKLINEGFTKKKSIEEVSGKYGRGYWSILKIVDGTENNSLSRPKNKQPDLNLR